MGRCSRTYNLGVNPTLLNRVAIALSMVGVYIAGVLSYSHAARVEVPCKADSTVNCAAVVNSPFGYLIGIPVAYLGLVTYLVILGLAVLRGRSSGAQWQRVTKAGFALTLVGVAFSLYLQTISISTIGQLCAWCLASAVTMLVLFIVHGMISQRGEPDAEEGEAASSVGPRRDVTVLAAMAILAVGAFGVTASSMRKELLSASSGFTFEGVTMEEVLGSPGRMKGPEDAKVLVVEVADINCPACRTNYPKMKKTFADNAGKMRMSFIHFPLFNKPGHETSIAGAMMSEYAADNGKFWEFMDRVFDESNTERVKQESGLYGIAGEIGLDIEDLKKKMDVDRDTTLLDRVNADFFNCVEKMKIGGTPAFILAPEGVQPKSYGFEGFEAAIKEPGIASLLK
jgi:protein-disulfide isomerase/uncharacterized membrane protein